MNSLPLPRPIFPQSGHNHHHHHWDPQSVKAEELYFNKHLGRGSYVWEMLHPAVTGLPRMLSQGKVMCQFVQHNLTLSKEFKCVPDWNLTEVIV